MRVLLEWTPTTGDDPGAGLTCAGYDAALPCGRPTPLRWNENWLWSELRATGRASRVRYGSPAIKALPSGLMPCTTEAPLPRLVIRPASRRTAVCLLTVPIEVPRRRARSLVVWIKQRSQALGSGAAEPGHELLGGMSATAPRPPLLPWYARIGGRSMSIHVIRLLVQN